MNLLFSCYRGIWNKQSFINSKKYFYTLWKLSFYHFWTNFVSKNRFKVLPARAGDCSFACWENLKTLLKKKKKDFLRNYQIFRLPVVKICRNKVTSLRKTINSPLNRIIVVGLSSEQCLHMSSSNSCTDSGYRRRVYLAEDFNSFEIVWNTF